MQFDVQIEHSVDDVGRDAWDALSGGRTLASYRWYRYSEKVLADNVPIYIILSRQGEPVARGTFWLRRKDQLPISSQVTRRLVEKLLDRWPLLLCRTPLTDVSGLILPQEPQMRDAALASIARVAYDQAQEHQASFVLYDYLTEEEARQDGWPGDCTALEVSEPGTKLSLTWPDFESYLGGLSKSTRKDYRRHRNRAADRQIEVTPHPMDAPLDEATLDRAVELIHNVENRHGAAPYPWARAMLKNAYMVDATWVKAEVEGRLMGCGLLLGEGDTREMKLLGLDYDIRYVYFQIVYAALRHVIEQRIRSLRGGSGAYEMKRRLGFEIEENNYVVFAGTGSVSQGLGALTAKGQ